DALHHVDVVARGPTGAVVAARAGFDGDRLRRTDRLAQLAGDAALLAVGVAPECVLATETRAQLTLFERVVDRRLGLEEVAERQPKGADEFAEEQRAGGTIEAHQAVHPVSLMTTATMTTIASEMGKKTFQPRRINWS